MKKILIVVVILSIGFLSACKAVKREDSIVEYRTGNFFNKNWDETIGTYKEAVVPNKETALELATVIFDGMDKSETEKKYVPQSVFYDEKDGIWIISFGKESNKTILGEDCSIAIREADGKVLRIWFGE